MDLKLNNVYHGFKFIEEKYIKELDSLGRIFEHEKSGARLVNLANNDDNKVFVIGFRTPPTDSTGVPHILEHSVLAGSRKFTTKEPFVDLLKSSLNTFLNAFTAPDKTMYPVASRNHKDFKNLVDVYLDAVFYPAIYNYEEIFMQEGWHYSLESLDAPLKYNGVVYNEMKGAYSSPDSLAFDGVKENLYPNTCYGHDSGGNPKFIPNLTYEDFLNFHRRYYHPSNSYILLYGDCNILEQLEFINDAYLKDFDRIDIDSSIAMEKPFDSLREFEGTYGISNEDSYEDKAYLGLGYVIGEATDVETTLAFEILQDMLIDNPAAPLKKAILDAGIGKSVDGSYDNGLKQPMFALFVKNANAEDKNKLIDVISSTLKDLCKNGINRDLAEASLNKMEFSLREADFGGYPKGIVYSFNIFNDYMYGTHPFAHLQYEPALEKMRANLDNKYFEGLIEKYILNNNHAVFYTLKPEKGLTEKTDKEVDAYLQDLKSKMSDDEKLAIIDKCKALRDRQTSTDTPEQIVTIPTLSIDDIDKKSDVLPIEERNTLNTKMLYHNINTNHIGYMKFMFDAKVLPEELIPYGKLLSDILGKLSTETYEYSDLVNQIAIHTGGIRFSLTNFTTPGNKDEFNAVFMVKAKALKHEFAKTCELIENMLSSTKFNEKNLILQSLRQVKSNHEGVIMNSGHIVAARKVLSYVSKKTAYEELTTGIAYYKFLANLEKNFDSFFEDLCSKLKECSKLLFNRNNLTLSFGGDSEDYAQFEKALPLALDKLQASEVKKHEYELNVERENEGLCTQANIQYVAKGGNFIDEGFNYSGALKVLQTIGKYDYLWNKIRVQGGAYGVMISMGMSGNMFLTSYRDPNLKETLDNYDGMVDYLKAFNDDEKTMTKYIIGTISGIDSPLTNAMVTDRAVENYYSNLTPQMVQKERDEVIATTAEDIRNTAALLEAVMKQNHYCAVGNEGKIRDNKDLFAKVENVII